MLFSMSALMWGCYPGGPEYYDEYDIVYTNYDKDFSFSGKNKYAIPDSVVKVTGNAAVGKPIEYVNATYNNIILDRIKANMSALGYTLVTDTAQADLIIFPAVLAVSYSTYYYDYWSYYYGYYYPYGGYYGYPVEVTYNVGSLLMDMISKNDVNPANKSRFVWTGVVNGLAEGSTADFTSRIKKTIDQAFTQSQYLQQ